MTICLCPDAAWASPWTAPGADLDSATVLAVAPTREAIVRIRRRSGAEETWSWVLPAGPATRLSGPVPHTNDPPLPPDTRIGGLSIDLEVEAPLGDRGRATLVVTDEHDRALPIEVLPPPGPIPTLGPRWVVDRWAVVAVDRPGGRRSLHVVDLARARARLLDAEALERFTAGEIPAAIALWQRSRAANATFGDAAYNLACAYARSGAIPLARQHLDQALAIDGPRYRLLARLDPDLSSVRTATRSVDPAPSSR